MKLISKTWKNLVDHIMNRLNAIENRTTEFMDEILFPISLAKETLTLLQENGSNCVVIEFFDAKELSHIVECLFELQKISLQKSNNGYHFCRIISNVGNTA